MLLTPGTTVAEGFPTPWFIATGPPRGWAQRLFLISIPFRTNPLIRTNAINEVFGNAGLMTTLLHTGIAGAMLALVISPDDVVITQLVKIAGQETLPTDMLG